MRNILARLTAFSLLAACLVYAQDTIILKNGEEVTAKVHKVGATEVEYRKADNPDGPLYALPKDRILMIRYKNGAKDIMAAEASSPAAAPVVSPVPPAAPVWTPPSTIPEDDDAGAFLLGAGYINYLEEGLNLSFLVGGFAPDRLRPMFIMYASDYSEYTGYTSLLTSIYGFSVGMSQGLNRHFFLYGTLGILFYEFSMSNDNYLIDDVEKSEIWPVMELGLGLVFKPLAVTAGFNAPNFEEGAEAFNLMVSLAF